MLIIKRCYNWFVRRLGQAFLSGHKPQMIIVGAQKSGTSSLHVNLSKIRGFCGSYPKEVHYFDREDNFEKGHDWYEKAFTRFRKGDICFEATPEYMARSFVPARIYEYNPHAKIVIIIRNPVERAYSAWNMYRDWNEKNFIHPLTRNDHLGRDESPIYKTFFSNGCPDFSDYLDQEFDLIENHGISADVEPALVRRGVYVYQVQRFFEIFGRDNVLVLGFNELRVKPDETIARLVDFMGRQCDLLASQSDNEVANKRNYESPMSNKDRLRLEDFYEPYNQELFSLLGFRPDW